MNTTSSIWMWHTVATLKESWFIGVFQSLSVLEKNTIKNVSSNHMKPLSISHRDYFWYNFQNPGWERNSRSSRGLVISSWRPPDHKKTRILGGNTLKLGELWKFAKNLQTGTRVALLHNRIFEINWLKNQIWFELEYYHRLSTYQCSL